MKGTFKSNDDLYGFAEDLKQARERGDDDIAQLIDHRLHGAWTSSEVLGGLLDAFVEIKPEIDSEYPLNTGKKLKEAIRAIRAAFRRANWGF